MKNTTNNTKHEQLEKQRCRINRVIAKYSPAHCSCSKISAHEQLPNLCCSLLMLICLWRQMSSEQPRPETLVFEMSSQHFQGGSNE